MRGKKCIIVNIRSAGDGVVIAELRAADNNALIISATMTYILQSIAAYGYVIVPSEKIDQQGK